MAQRIWKRVKPYNELNGYGNGYRAVIYCTPALPNSELLDLWSVLIYKGDKRVDKYITNSELGVKRWAETKYLRGKP